MNPSEYLFNEDFMILNDDYKLKVINKLDKRFINREELKDKINNILNGRYKPWFEKVNGLKEELLELLK